MKYKYKKDRILIEEDIRWKKSFYNIFSSRKQKEWSNLIDELESNSYCNIHIDKLISDLNKIKRYFRKNAKNNYENIKVVPTERRWDDSDYRNYMFTIVVGRYENRKEFKERIKKRILKDNEENNLKIQREKRKLEELQNKYSQKCEEAKK